MKFRPCIDIHNGQVKQIVGSSLKDTGDYAKENFVSQQDASFYADLYKKNDLPGGHIILLNPIDSPFYKEDLHQAGLALEKFKYGMQVGGGITAENAEMFLEMGASHVVVTSYVFKDGEIRYDNLHKMVKCVGKEHLVLDLSCRKKENQYYIVTDRWQKFTNVCMSESLMDELSEYCDEFLIHAVDVEGKASGIEKELVAILSKHDKNPITYAGGISSYDDLETLKNASNGKIDFTIGSALDLFGGKIEFNKIVNYR